MSPQYYRIVWKEYRALSPFWIGLFVVHAGICAVAVAAVVANQQDLINAFVSASAAVVALGFAVGSLVMAFTGEDENDTAMLMRMLPAATPSVFSAKLTIVALGTLCLLLACGALNLLVILWANQPWSPEHAAGYVPISLPEAMTLLLGAVTAMVGCLICALHTRRVMMAFTGIAIWLALLQYIVRWSLFHNQPMPVFVVFVLCAVVVWSSARRWHLGQLGGRLRQRSAVRKPLQISSHFSAGWQALWYRPLRYAAARATVSSRSVAVLIWQECRRASIYALSFLTAGLLLFVLELYLRDLFVPSILLVAVACIEAGLRSFRHDQQKFNGMFWSYRGISPAKIWLVRNLIWLPATLLVVCSLALMEVMVIWALPAGPPNSLNGDPPLFELADKLKHEMRRGPAPNLWTIGKAIWVMAPVVASFFVAQLCSYWIRKPLIAAFAAFFVSIPVVAWWGYLFVYDMPGTLLYAPLIILIVLAAFVTRRQWMDRRSGVGLQTLRWSIVGLAAACLWPLSQLWWAIEIPQASAVYPDKRPARPAADYSVENATGAWAQAWQRLEDVSSSESSAFYYDIAGCWWNELGYRDTNAVRSTRDGALDESQQAIREKQLEAIDDVCGMWFDKPQLDLPPQWRLPWNGHEGLSSTVTRGLLLAAYGAADEQNYERALERLLQAVDLNRRFKTESTNWLHWKQAMLQESLALRTLRDIASKDSVTEQQLAHARTRLVELHRQSEAWTLSSVPVNRLEAYTSVLTQKEVFADTELEHRLLPDEDYWPVRHVRGSWAERQRFLRLCDNLAHFSELDVLNSVFADQLRMDFSHWIQQDRYATDLLAGDITSLPVSLELGWQYQLQSRIVNEERGTAVVLALQEYRRRHGEFPATLTDLGDVGLDRNISLLLRNITNNAEIRYAVKGYGEVLPIMTETGRLKLLPANQPVLWFSGPLGPERIHLSERTSATAELDPGVVVFMNGTGSFPGGPNFLLDYIQGFRRLSKEGDPDYDVHWLELPDSFNGAGEPEEGVATQPDGDSPPVD